MGGGCSWLPLMSRTHRTMSYGNADDEFRILVIGKSGNGKSTLCNAILGDNKFKVGRGMAATTSHAEYATTFKGNKKLKVVDTPDITNWRMSATEMLDEVSKWRLFTMSRPSAVVLTVRCDIRYTAEEFAIYREIVKHWGDKSIKDNLVVAFTFGDCQDEPIEEELKTVCPELQSVLRDAGHRYFVFDKTSEQSRSGAAYSIMDAVQRKKNRGGGGFPSVGGTLSSPGSDVFSRVIAILVVVLVIVVICCIVFVVLKIVGAAIGFGVIGIILVIVLLMLVYGKKIN